MKLGISILCLIYLNIATANEYTFYSEIDKHYKFHLEPKTWFEAIEICKGENATLAMPKNDAEAKILKDIFNNFPASMIKGATWGEYMLLRFHDLYHESEYLTLEEVPILYYFHNWNSGQPDNFLFGEDCGSLHRNGNINDVSCQAKCVFTCEKDEINNQREVETLESVCISNDPAYKCSNDLEYCYKLHLNPLSWGMARQICKYEGGHLAMIYTASEEQFLKQMFNADENKSYQTTVPEYALLGFHDLYKENNFFTVKGESFVSLPYLNWQAGNPNNLWGNEHCGSMHKSGKINDISCDTVAPFFCQRVNNNRDLNIIDVRFGQK